MSSSTGEFFSGRPNDDVPGNSNLPERYIPRTIEGMMPDEIAYFRVDSDCFAIDPTGRLYVYQGYEYFSQNHGDPDSKDEAEYDDETDENEPDICWIGLMHVYAQVEGGHVIDTYIADVREVYPGEIEMIDDYEFLAELTPVLGIVSEDDNGKLSYGCANSDRLTNATIGAAEILARNMNSILKAAEPAGLSPAEQPVAVTDVKEPKPVERLPKKRNPKKGSPKNQAAELPKDKDGPKVDES